MGNISQSSRKNAIKEHSTYWEIEEQIRKSKLKTTHGGKRKNAGRPKGVNKVKRTYSIDVDLTKNKITSKLVNELLTNHYEQQNN